MSQLRALYQEVILDHSKNPRNFCTLDDANATGEGFNPLCGDKLTIYLHLNGDIIERVSFQGSGCAISQASASMMTQQLTGKTVEQAGALFENIHDMVTAPPGTEPDTANLDKLSVFEGVREFPMRVKCATLAWHTLQAALEKSDSPARTE